MTIMWAKLKDGAFGLRGVGLREGTDVIVTKKKSGETSRATVGKVIWTGPDGVCLATVGAKVSRRGYGPGRCVECGDSGRLGVGCTGDPRRCFDCDS